MDAERQSRNQMNLTAEIAKSAERQSRNRNRGIREIRGRRETSRAVFRVFRVFCGSSHWGNCSQAANNLDYCRAADYCSAEMEGVLFVVFALTAVFRMI